MNRIVSSYSNEANNLRVRNHINNENINNEDNINSRIKQISIQYHCCTPYFKLGNIIFFYFPNSLNNLEISNKYYSNLFDLSLMPDPPFAIGSKCKYSNLSNFSRQSFFIYIFMYIYFFIINIGN